MVPLVVSNVGVTVMVMAWPVLVAAVLPEIETTPALVTLPADILPVIGIVIASPAFAESAGLTVNFSEIAVRAPPAARINSEAFARTV